MCHNNERALLVRPSGIRQSVNAALFGSRSSRNEAKDMEGHVVRASAFTTLSAGDIFRAFSLTPGLTASRQGQVRGAFATIVVQPVLADRPGTACLKSAPMALYGNPSLDKQLSSQTNCK